MTWGEFKYVVQASGVTDSDHLSDIHGIPSGFPPGTFVKVDRLYRPTEVRYSPWLVQIWHRCFVDVPWVDRPAVTPPPPAS